MKVDTKLLLDRMLPIKFDNIKEAKEWTKQYENQKHLVLGQTQFPYVYLSSCILVQ